MRDARIRVVLHPRLEAHEATAAMEAAERFSRFGLRVESMRDPQEKIWKDLCRKKVYELVFNDGESALHGDEMLGRPDYFSRIPHDGAILAGITPHRIFYSSGARSMELEGFNMQYVGAVVSASSFRLSGMSPFRASGPSDIREASEAIELCMAHEIGHSLLGRVPFSPLFPNKDEPKRYDENGHCLSSGCLMQNVTDYVAFLRSAAAQRIGFCDGCADLLGGRVTEIQWYGMA